MTAVEELTGIGHRWEDQVAAFLTARGFDVAYYGQRTADFHTQRVVRQFHPHLAHAPDLLVLNMYGEPIAIDAKWTSRTDTGLHGVNNAAREGLADFAEHYGALGLFAFRHDGERVGFMNVADWRAANPWPGPNNGNGSGTPYELVKCACVFLDEPRPG